MSSYWSPSLDRGFSSRTDFRQVNHDRTRRLAAKLFRVARPVLGIQPRRENAYIALDAVAWVAARILVGLEDRDACDFFDLALTKSLAQLGGVRNSNWCPSATSPWQAPWRIPVTASFKSPSRRMNRADSALPNHSLGEGQVTRPRLTAESLLDDIVMPRHMRALIADRLEVLLVEAMARGRQLARKSMRSRRRN
jgi:hypothetical protein